MIDTTKVVAFLCVVWSPRIGARILDERREDFNDISYLAGTSSSAILGSSRTKLSRTKNRIFYFFFFLMIL